MKSGRELLIRPKPLNGLSGDTQLIQPAAVGFEYLTFRVRKLVKGDSYPGETGANELCLVVLGGRCSVESTAGSWSNFGGRAHVFNGLPYALYLPINTGFTVSAESDCELAFCFCPAEQVHPAHLITPAEVEVE